MFAALQLQIAYIVVIVRSHVQVNEEVISQGVGQVSTIKLEAEELELSVSAWSFSSHPVHAGQQLTMTHSHDSSIRSVFSTTHLSSLGVHVA